MKKCGQCGENEVSFLTTYTSSYEPNNGFVCEQVCKECLIVSLTEVPEEVVSAVRLY